MQGIPAFTIRFLVSCLTTKSPLTPKSRPFGATVTYTSVCMAKGFVGVTTPVLSAKTRSMSAQHWETESIHRWHSLSRTTSDRRIPELRRATIAFLSYSVNTRYRRVKARRAVPRHRSCASRGVRRCKVQWSLMQLCLNDLKVEKAVSAIRPLSFTP